MRLDAAEDLAMILPISVIANSSEDVMKFLDFSGYAGFFEDVEKNFKVPAASSYGNPFGDPARSRGLKVEKVGNFDASFVPTVADFSRLDERFRLSGDVWQELPQYDDYGFVVFKLRKGAAQVHPMGFAFPTRDRSQITFPTVHIHDGKVHKKAGFDHSLYCQSPSDEFAMKWRESDFLAQYAVKCSKASGTVRPKEHIYKKRLIGKLKNEDLVIGAAANA
ncbi:MAG: hypothetical protein QM496_20640 [Verrucomicrobiota bacterium]